VADVEQPGDRHAAPERLQLVQDLVNTVDLEGGTEELDTPAALTAWMRGRGIDPGACGEQDFAEALLLREALRDVCSAHAGTDVPPDRLALLDRLLAGAPLLLSLDARGAAMVVPAPGLTGAAALAAHVAAAIAAGSADGTWQRLKACASDTCRWAYYDRSPAGRSRWCTMSLCGSRAKMRAYRSRK
jgi:predicted RNA-binding Zn ribbon-like protein